MADDEQQATRPPRKPYLRPELSKVQLRPQEAVLGGCKTMGVGGPGNPMCSDNGSCFTLGS